LEEDGSGDVGSPEMAGNAGRPDNRAVELPDAAGPIAGLGKPRPGNGGSIALLRLPTAIGEFGRDPAKGSAAGRLYGLAALSLDG